MLIRKIDGCKATITYAEGDLMFKIGDHIWIGNNGYVVTGLERPTDKEHDKPGTVTLILSS
jgi:hypothetical protein